MKNIWKGVEQKQPKHLSQDCYNLYRNNKLIKTNITCLKCSLIFFYTGGSKDEYFEQYEKRCSFKLTKKQMSKQFKKTF